jgi:uncharacterized protein YggT (Ycf19 family)
MTLVGLLNAVFDFCFIVLLVRAVVPNEGHMAFNRPYQFTVRMLEPLWRKLKIPDRQVAAATLIALLALAGVRGLVWTLMGAHLDFEITEIRVLHRTYWQFQLLSALAAAAFLLHIYAFLTLAIAIGDLENRTDHYSRLMRAMLGPLRQVPVWWRCAFPALGLALLLACMLWMLPWMELHPSTDLANCILHSIPLALAMIVDLARVWIVLLIARCVLSLVPVWRPPVVEVIERVTEPALKPFQRFPLKAGQFDFTPVVAILALAVAHWAVLGTLQRIYLRL